VAADKWSQYVMACRIGWSELSPAGPEIRSSVIRGWMVPALAGFGLVRG
jgi:hypothetical protein